MRKPECFPDVPSFRIHGYDGDNMVMMLTHYVRVCTSKGWVTIPTGFLTDGLSIPRFAWPIVGPTTGKAFLAGLLHDYLYSRSSTAHFFVDRKTADSLFLEAMHNLGIGFRRNLIYSAVRMFGWKHYKKR